VASLECDAPCYASRIGSIWCAYKVLTYKEYKTSERVKRIFDGHEYYDYLVRNCLIYPKDWKTLPALYVPKIARKIEDVSGFNNMGAFTEALNFSRQEMHTLEPSIDVFLKTALMLPSRKLV